MDIASLVRLPDGRRRDCSRLAWILGLFLLLAWTPIASAKRTNLVFGMSAALSGPAADLGLEMRDGVMAGFARANRTGGVKGRLLQLIALDDGYEPARVVPNMHHLLEKEEVLAIIGNVGTPTGIAALPIAKERETLFFAPFTGAGAFRTDPPERFAINVRASYAEEAAAVVDLLVAVGVRLDEIAVFTQKDAYGDAGYAGIVAAMKRHGLQNEGQIMHVRYERNTLLVEDALAAVLYGRRDPRAFIMVGAYAPCAKFIRLANNAGMRPLFHNVSFVGSASLAAEIGHSSAHVVVTQVVPHPMKGGTRLGGEYLADIAALKSGATPSFGSFEGYLAARILIMALERGTGEPTRVSIIDAFESLGQFDLGLGQPLELSATEHQACHQVWLTKLHAGEIIPASWEEIRTLLPPRTRP